MEDPAGHEEEELPKVDVEFRKFDEEDYINHRNIYVGVHMSYGKKHHHRHHRHRHHKKRHAHSNSAETTPNSNDVTDHLQQQQSLCQPEDLLAPGTPINPCDRVKFILGEDDTGVGGALSNSSSNVVGCTSRQLFTEMDELCCYPDHRMEWKETARWIKFEEDLEEDADRWSKPHVATLSLRSLFELRSCVLRGSVQLDLDAENLSQICDLVLDNLVANNHLEEEYRSLVREALLQRHCHHNNSGILRRNNSSVQHGDDSKGPSPSMSRQTSFSEAKRTSSFAPLLPIKNLLSSLQQQSMSEDLEEGVATGATRPNKVDQHVMKKLPSNAEASNVLVGEVETLPHTVIAFVRLSSSVLLGDLTEVPIPTRFIFVLLGPLGNRARYHEVGRSIATLMSDPVFHDVAYKAKSREDLLAGIDEFLDKVTVLPPGEWDPQIRIEPPENLPSPTARVSMATTGVGESPKVVRRKTITKQTEELVNFQCEKRPFSGLVHDGRRWRSRFFSDIRDAFHWHSIAAIILMFFVTLTLAVSLGKELEELTGDEMGVPESLLMASLGNILSSLFSGQPLVVMVASRSTVVLDAVLYDFASSNSIPFLPFRFWVGIWTMLLLLLLVMVNASGVLLTLTRFTLEIFSVLLSITFIGYIAVKMWDIYDEYPHSHHFFYPIAERSCDCISNGTNSTNLAFVNIPLSNCTGEDYQLTGDGCPVNQSPDVFFLSIILLVGTFMVAMYLRKFARTPFFTSLIRDIVCRFAAPISLVIWVAVDIVAHEDTPLLPIKSNHKLANDRTLLVNPVGIHDNRLPVWAIIAAIIPAVIATLLISCQHLVSIHCVNKKMKKGRGYHLDLVVAAFMAGVSAILGFPWILAALVPTLAHIDILSVMLPGKQTMSIKEQRVTGLVVGMLLAVSVAAKPVLSHLPLPVLYGILLLVGVYSLSNIQFVQRLALLFITDKHKPDCCYVRSIPNRRIHSFTLLQLLLVVLMCVVVFSPAILGLPVLIVVLALIRWIVLGSLFSARQLEILDDPLIKLHCPRQQLQQQSTTSPAKLESQDNVDQVEASINISVEMEKCDLWRHMSYSERSPPPPRRLSTLQLPPTQHQCTEV